MPGARELPWALVLSCGLSGSLVLPVLAVARDLLGRSLIMAGRRELLSRSLVLPGLLGLPVYLELCRALILTSPLILTRPRVRSSSGELRRALGLSSARELRRTLVLARPC